MAAVVALLVAGCLFYFLHFRSGEESREAGPPSPSDAAELAASPPESLASQPQGREGESEALPPVGAPLPLPTLVESDPLIRDLTVEASPRPELAAWLVTPELIRRFVAAVASVADGESPREQLLFLAPEKPFRVVQRDGRLVADPRSHARYDVVADVFSSLHVPTLVRVYRLAQPLFEQAFAELGIRDRTFEETLAQAIGELLRAPRVEGAAELQRVGKFYEYPDESLEGRSPAQRHLLRMGPRNALRIQAKLREIERELGFAGS